MFYGKLRKLGLRAHHVKQIYTYAQSVVVSARSNGGKKPILRKLTARIDKYDYKLDLDTTTLTLKLHNGYEARLKLVTGGTRGLGDTLKELEMLLRDTARELRASRGTMHTK